ncbi:MAG: Sec-independent protein translocase protein TatB [Ketobacter sp.]
MFDIGFFELVLLGIVGLLVLGPERLPHAVRMGSAYLGKIRRAVTSVREEFEREVNLHEMQERLKQQMEETGLDDARQSLQDLKQQVENPDPTPATSSQPMDNSIGGSLPAREEDDPDTRHNPTAPENEAEPMPDPAPESSPEPAANKESPKA